MAFAASEFGLVQALDLARTRWMSEPYRIKLYRNDFDPVPGCGLADFTECNFQDYTYQDLDDFGFVSYAAGKAKIVTGLHLWTMGVPGTTNVVYGYYVTDGDNDHLIFAERDPAAPRSMVLLGQTYSVIVGVTLANE